MVLPSLHQLIRNMSWPTDFWYAKIDFKHAFYSLELHEKSRYVTTFRYDSKYYRFTSDVNQFLKQILYLFKNFSTQVFTEIFFGLSLQIVTLRNNWFRICFKFQNQFLILKLVWILKLVNITNFFQNRLRKNNLLYKTFSKKTFF